MRAAAVYRTNEGTWLVEKCDETLYRITAEGVEGAEGAEGAEVQGYLERDGSHWLTLRGARRDHCVEIGESRTLERAAALLVRDRPPRRPSASGAR